KSARISKIVEVNHAIGRADRLADIDDFFGIVGVQGNSPSLHSGKLFKQDGYAFQNGHGGLGTDISQTQYGAAISYNRYGISLDREVSSVCLIFGDGLADSSDPGRIGAGEVITVA